MAGAGDAPGATPAGLYDRPVLVVDPGVHTAKITGLDGDRDARFLVTSSLDKTVRVWSGDDGRLLRTIRLPTGPGNLGMAYAVAISPHGSTIAVGGWLSSNPDGDFIYLFDRATGQMTRRITGLPDGVAYLAYAPNGEALIAALGGGCGVRLFDARSGGQLAADPVYGGASYGAAFDRDGRIATTCDDGKIRLYQPGLERPITVEAPAGEPAQGIAFSPEGDRIAVGYESMRVDVLDGRTLALEFSTVAGSIPYGSLASVAWSNDGATLYAAGDLMLDGRRLIRAWGQGGRGTPSDIAVAESTIVALHPLPGGRLAAAAADPRLLLLDRAGEMLWQKEPLKADFRGQHHGLLVNADGSVVEFGFGKYGFGRARFDLRRTRLTLDPPADSMLAAPRMTELEIDGWRNEYFPNLDGRPLRLKPYERSRCLAIAPDAQSFTLGTDWYLRRFDRLGQELWAVAGPSSAWAANITGDGRLIVAAYGDGTIRWHKLADGTELLVFMPLADRANWVAWTPEGFYAATPGAHGVLRWHVNRGWEEAAEDVPVSDIPGSFRPAVLPLVLQELETARALGLALLAEHRRAVQVRTHSRVPPGAQLHLLAIGVSTYNETHARHLRLKFADRDAWDVASALLNTQTSLYADVKLQVLRDGEATKAGILRAFAAMREGMRRGTGQDLAVVHFSGHGAVVGGRLYLLPHEVDARETVGIETTALSIDDLRTKLLELAQLGRVLVLLDACRSGAATLDGAGMPPDAAALRAQLVAANVTVLTSSSGTEPSREDEAWGHGAFTHALLEALGGAADADRDGLVGVTELAGYLARRVAALTDGAQAPGIEVRFEGGLFVVGL